MARRKRPRIGQRVHSVKLDGKLGRVTGWQPETPSKAERWLVKPDKPGALACWLELHEFVSAPEDEQRRWV